MFEWFGKSAPIRVKFRALLVVHALLTGTCLAATLLAVHAHANGSLLDAAAVSAFLLTIAVVVVSGRLICTPYVTTVVRMEDLLAGDIDSPVRFTDHGDCVGRMAKAMTVFQKTSADARDAAIAQTQIVAALRGGLERMAQNDLTYRIETKFPESHEQLRTDYNRALDAVAKTISTVASAAEGINTGSNEIRAASNDLASRTEEQAASLSETASAMGQLTTMVHQTAKSAAEVNVTIDQAYGQANDGGQVVERAVLAMTAIEKSSQEISQIINLIDGISFQTNLLALNAGVEAARAGEAGRGFAVVASEVRALAQRSADAANDIKQLIQKSTSQVVDGVALVDETGTVLRGIVSRVGEVRELISTIARSAETQASNVQQVNGSVGAMDKMTQQNAAMVEESTAAARSLADEATALTDIVSRFRTGQEPVQRQARSVVPMAVRAAPRARKATVSGNLALQTTPVDDDDWSEF